MNSMERLEQLISGMGNGWEIKLNNYLRDDYEGLNEAELQICNEFLYECKEDEIKGRKDQQEKVKARMNNDLLYKALCGWVKDALKIYDATNSLRILEKKNSKKANALVDDIFEKAVVRYYPGFDEQYQNYAFESQDEFGKIISVLLSLSECAAEKCLHKEAVERMVYQNTRLSKPLCKYITEKIEQNFDQIRMKIIMEKLCEMQEDL